MRPGEVAVWYWRTDHLGEADRHWIDAVLSEDERKRRERFVFERDRRDYSAAHALLRRVLSMYGSTAPQDWRFETQPKGKPVLVEEQAETPPLHFNISHTHGLVACAVSRGSEVGIDVECATRTVNAPSIVARYFTAVERKILEAVESDRYAGSFAELWTLKESYMKAVGDGIALGLDSFAFTFHETSGLRFMSPPGKSHARFWLAAVPFDARLAVAVVTSSDTDEFRVSFNDFDPREDAHPLLLLRQTTPSDD